MARVSHQKISAVLQNALIEDTVVREMPFILFAPQQKDLVIRFLQLVRNQTEIEILHRVHQCLARITVRQRLIILLDDSVIDHRLIIEALLQTFLYISE